MRAEQTLAEKAEEILLRQASVLARRTGQPLGEARETVLQTRPGGCLGSCAKGVYVLWSSMCPSAQNEAPELRRTPLLETV